MRIIKIKGGLGNQMFQYAFAKLLEKETSEIVKLDFQDYCYRKNDSIRVPRIKQFKLSIQEASRTEINKVKKFSMLTPKNFFTYRFTVILEILFNKKYFYESNRAYRDISNLHKFGYYDGYWQSYKYIDSIIESLKEDFITKNKLSKSTINFQKKLKNENSVFIGVRKGDYTKNRKTVKHYGYFTNDYYLKAIKIISQQVNNPVFYIFSNDIEWCKENLNLHNYNVKYREIEEQVNDFEELLLMSSCKHAIIVNSTFNWWGARLISNSKKIIVCPDKWFFDDKPIDIIPPHWIRLK